MSGCSEYKFKCQLDRARAADLVEGVEAAVCAAGAEAVRQRLCREAEQGAGQAMERPSWGWLKMLKNSERKLSRSTAETLDPD